MVQNPGDLGRGEIGIRQQARALSDQGLRSIGFQTGTEISRAPVLPDDGVVNGTSGLAVPDNGSFALVGDADGSDIRGRQGCIGQRGPRSLKNRAGFGNCWGNSRCAMPRILYAPSKTMAREDVVP
jgi:hypothetical protein